MSKKTDTPARKPFAARLCALRCLTPLHVGGEGEPGLIDKPVMRERARPYPLLPGSAIKGVLRDDAIDQGPAGHFTLAFGRANAQGLDGDNAGSLVFTDGLIVALPVRSYFGTMAWVTCSDLLNRHRGWWFRMQLHPPPLFDNASPKEAQTVAGSSLVRNKHLLVEDLAVPHRDNEQLRAWRDWIAERWFGETQEREYFKDHFAVVPTDVFDHLCRYALEVRARIAIDRDSRIVEKGKLWYEEMLPESTLLGSTVFCERVFKRANQVEAPEPDVLLDTFCKGNRKLLQFGGTASVGRGFTELRFAVGKPQGDGR